MNNQPIGIFDSGIGGLTVANAISTLLPNEQLVYFGDTAHLPYGDKSFDLILCRHTLEHLPTEYNIEFLKECKRVCKYLFVTGYNKLDITNRQVPNTIYRPINLKLSPYLEILNPYYIHEF
jgi:ubiquinone/menaquinone biosynthesis C-methylase UbiE